MQRTVKSIVQNKMATEKDEIIHSLASQRIAFAAMAGKHDTIAALNALNAKNCPTRVFALTVISDGAGHSGQLNAEYNCSEVIEKTNTNPATEAEDVVIRSALGPGSQRSSECELAAFYAGFHGMSINFDI
ncbi:hypothetical protein Tco_1234529 [Tanacetum coccineum]